MATKTVSIVTGGNNNATVTAAEINAIATDFIADGVVGAIGLNTGSGGTGSFAVNAQGTPDMTVRVSAGQAYITATPSGGSSQRIRVSMDTYEDVNISANSTGSTRYDFLYLVVSASALANPGANKDDVVTLTTSRSTSSATDNGTPPTYGYKLGVITVANGASSITNSNITDSRTSTGAAYLSDGAVQTIDIAAGAVTPSKLDLDPANTQVTTSGTTASTSYTSTLSGSTAPAATVTIGSNGILLVIWRAQSQNSGANNNHTSVALSGANTVAASDNYCTLNQSTAPVTGYGTSHMFTGLSTGSTTVTMNYRVSGGTGTFSNMEVIAIPL